MRILFLGGPGNISESAIRRFLAKGFPVAAVKRTQDRLIGTAPGLSLYYGNRNERDFLRRVLDEFRPDITVDCTCFEMEQARTAAAAVRESLCRRFIFISTADVYGYPLSRLPMRESDPWRQSLGEYALKKKEIEFFYREAFREGKPYLTIVRPAYSLGKTFALTSFERDRGAFLVTRLRQGLPVYSPGDGTTLIDASAAYNTGMMLARICESDATIGEDYNCGHDRATTYDEYIQAFADAAGVRPNIVHIPTDFMLSLGRKEVEDSILEELAQHNLYFSVEKFRRQFPDFVWEYSLTDAVKDFIAYQEAAGGFEGTEKPMFEDRVVQLWQQEMPGLRCRVQQGLDGGWGTEHEKRAE